MSLIQPNKPDRPNRPHEQDRLADCFSILLSNRYLVGGECIGQLPGWLNSQGFLKTTTAPVPWDPRHNVAVGFCVGVRTAGVDAYVELFLNFFGHGLRIGNLTTLPEMYLDLVDAGNREFPTESLGEMAGIATWSLPVATGTSRPMTSDNGSSRFGTYQAMR